MNITNIVQAINTVGFPIFAFIVTIWFIRYMYDKNIEQHREDMDKLNTLAESVNNNSKAIAELTKQLTVIENDIK